MMGEEIPWDEVSEARATELEDHFKPVRISPVAINEASKIVPSEFWINEGLHRWLSKRADYAFSKLPNSDAREVSWKQLKYIFEFDVEGPVLKTVVFLPFGK